MSPGGGSFREGRPLTSEGPGFRRNSPAMGDARSQDGSRPPRREFQGPSTAELDTAWRARMRPDPPAPKEPSNPTSPAAAPASPAGSAAGSAAAPASRPKLNLQKRTVPESPAAPIAGESKASPFGGARPIDSAARERQVEERRVLSVRQKKEAEEKAKAEKAEKAEEKRQAKEQARAEKATTADPNGRDVGETPQGGKNFDILRQAGGDENEMAADRDPEEQAGGTAEQAQDSKQAAGGPSANEEQTEEVDDGGWSTVNPKQRSNRRGRPVA